MAVGCGSEETPLGGVGTGTPAFPPPNQIQCSIPLDEVFSGGVDRGQIPDLTNPEMVDAGDPAAAWLLDTDRVIGLQVGGDWIAIPHNILWWHEIVNLTSLLNNRIAVTYCPLTGSSIVFSMGGVSRFIVSGLLFNNNLMMLDGESESFWPQMSRGARCGPNDGESLRLIPSIEITWGGWKKLHPDTRVVSQETGFERDYRWYPYGLYEELNAPPQFDVPQPDRRRQGKERVLGVVGSSGATSMAFPFLELADAGDRVAAQTTVDGLPTLVLWDADDASAVALRPELDGQSLTFEVRNGEFRDRETDSTWRLDGLAIAGPLAGRALEPIADAFVSFWFAWSTFERNTEIWRNP
jgi:hypothetical protein